MSQLPPGKVPYTPGMREVLKQSKAEAGRLGHDYIGPEHYLLGIIRKGDGNAVQILLNLHVDLDLLKDTLERRVGGRKWFKRGLWAPNADAKRVFDAAKAAAVELQHNWIGTEHLLLGLLKVEESIPARYFYEIGITYDSALPEVLKVIEGGESSVPAMALARFSPVIIETPRLLIRQWVPDDWKRARPLFTLPEVMRYIGDGKPRSDEQIQRFINGGIEQTIKRGWALWPVIYKEDAELIGFCGFNDGYAPDVEIGWRLLPGYWGRGLATEAARAVLNYGFNVIGFPHVISVAQADNVASIKIMEKLGMQLQSRSCEPGTEIELVRYRIAHNASGV